MVMDDDDRDQSAGLGAREEATAADTRYARRETRALRHYAVPANLRIGSGRRGQIVT